LCHPLPRLVDQRSFWLDIIVRTDDASGVRFPGGKFRCYQKLINLIPPHRVYIETHLGGGAVLRNKAPAEMTIGIDRDPAVIRTFSDFSGPNFRFVTGPAESFLPSYPFRGDEFIYADPPYWPAARRSPRRHYRFDYTEADHLRLLDLLRSIPCPVMISGYRNAAYDAALPGWAKFVFTGTSHTGRREEIVWINYKPALLHDSRFLGSTFRQRQAIKRKRARWLAKFVAEPSSVQQAVLADLTRIFRQNQPIQFARL
jgi:hypothetical protein